MAAAAGALLAGDLLGVVLAGDFAARLAAGLAIANRRRGISARELAPSAGHEFAMAASALHRVLEETLTVHTNSTYEHVQTVSESPLWWVGVLLDAVATLAGTGGKQLLRHAAVSKNMWFYPLGLVCTAVIDPAFDISAYSFAAQSIIAPCAGMVVVWNVLLAPWTLGEKYTRPRLVGAALICFGTVLVGLFGNHTEVDRTVDEYLALFARPAAVAYYVLFAAWTVLCAVLYRRGCVRPRLLGRRARRLAREHVHDKAVIQMLKCVAFNGDDATSGCTHNPFLTIFPYLFRDLAHARVRLAVHARGRAAVRGAC